MSALSIIYIIHNMNNIYKRNKNKGFTLIEILVVIGIIGILAAVVLVAVNPSRQFKQARDSQRLANINTILNAIGQNIADHQGNLFCPDTGVTSVSSQEKMIGTDPIVGFDAADCLVPEYLSKLPFDPDTTRSAYISDDNYYTGYKIQAGEAGRITVTATGELQPLIQVSR